MLAAAVHNSFKACAARWHGLQILDPGLTDINDFRPPGREEPQSARWIEFGAAARKPASHGHVPQPRPIGQRAGRGHLVGPVYAKNPRAWVLRLPQFALSRGRIRCSSCPCVTTRPPTGRRRTASLSTTWSRGGVGSDRTGISCLSSRAAGQELLDWPEVANETVCLPGAGTGARSWWS
jgi:hypothetical protein